VSSTGEGREVEVHPAHLMPGDVFVRHGAWGAVWVRRTEGLSEPVERSASDEATAIRAERV